MRLLLIVFVLATFAFGEIKLPTSFSTSFKQIVTNPKKKKFHYSGTLQFSTANGLKWIYKKPTKKDVCSDKVRLVVVDHDLEQVSYYKLNKAIDLEKIIKNAKLVRQNVYNAKYDGKEYTLKVNKQQEVTQIAYYDDLENMVQIVFTNLKSSSKDIAPSRLECKIPASYDTIDG
ncbi:MAG: outer-membrane lipoprotein carrier protein LolA [Campylobacterales bacterium]|nr:outer-membrane lipoprotein carrier protein LolA [Campylobacterales bacterium]